MYRLLISITRLWKILSALLLSACISLASAQTFSLFEVASTSSAAVVCNAMTGVATGVGSGTCMSTPATCDGVTDDAPAFKTFNTWAVSTWQGAYTGQIELVLPSNT